MKWMSFPAHMHETGLVWVMVRACGSWTCCISLAVVWKSEILMKSKLTGGVGPASVWSAPVEGSRPLSTDQTSFTVQINSVCETWASSEDCGITVAHQSKTFTVLNLTHCTHTICSITSWTRLPFSPHLLCSPLTSLRCGLQSEPVSLLFTASYRKITLIFQVACNLCTHIHRSFRVLFQMHGIKCVVLFQMHVWLLKITEKANQHATKMTENCYLICAVVNYKT